LRASSVLRTGRGDESRIFSVLRIIEVQNFADELVQFLVGQAGEVEVAEVLHGGGDGFVERLHNGAAKSSSLLAKCR